MLAGLTSSPSTTAELSRSVQALHLGTPSLKVPDVGWGNVAQCCGLAEFKEHKGACDAILALDGIYLWPKFTDPMVALPPPCLSFVPYLSLHLLASSCLNRFCQPSPVLRT